MLPKGTAFPLVQALLKLNEGREEPIVEVVVMSRNSPETGLRIFNSLDHYELQITRAALTGGERLALYMEAFKVDLFLSKDESDVQEAVNAGVAAARVYIRHRASSRTRKLYASHLTTTGFSFRRSPRRSTKPRGCKLFRSTRGRTQRYRYPRARSRSSSLPLPRYRSRGTRKTRGFA